MRADDRMIWVEANVLGTLRALPGRNQNHPVRFWIITMMLVLVGLSTLKLR
jgi:UDP-N-acetylmuramyl pentapeptide phosphotransferase/UDP-N-acetylglucosamine-1-phosphate transferase